MRNLRDMPYVEKRKYLRILFLGMFAALVCLMFYASTLGAANITFLKAVRIVFNFIEIMIDKIPLLRRLVSPEAVDDTHSLIVLKIRMPRIFMAALVGAGLSTVGATFQGMFKNPMADPGVIGISSGAALGATLAIVIGIKSSFLGLGIITVFAFAGALITTSGI